MRAVIVRKVPFRPSKATDRLLWALVLAEDEGLTLLLVRKTDDNRNHSLVIASENVEEKVFEPENVCEFPVGGAATMGAIASRLEALADDFSDGDIESFLKSHGIWD